MRKTISVKEIATILGLSATFLVVALLAFTFLMVTLILVVLGFSGPGETVSVIAKVLLLAFPVLFVISVILGWRGIWGKAENNFSKSKKMGGEISELGPGTR